MVKKMNHIRTLLLFATTAVLLMLPALRPALATEPSEPDYVTLADTKYEIDNLKDESIIRLPITMRADVSAVEVKLADVALGTRHDQALAQAFTTEVEKVTEGAAIVPSIIVKIKTAGLEQGTYHLRIEVRPTGRAQPAGAQTRESAVRPAAKAVVAPVSQSLNVELTLPAATLRPTGTLIVEQVQPFFGSLADSSSRALTLTESSGKRTRL